MKTNVVTIIILLFTVFLFGQCSRDRQLDENQSGAEYFVTKGDGSLLLSKQTEQLNFTSVDNGNPVVEVNTAVQFQTVDGFGFNLTGGSAMLINHMTFAERESLLKELFSTDTSSIGISCIRISIGASDLSSAVFSYDDLPAGQTDTSLQHFSLAQDTVDLIPILQRVIALNPNIKIIATPWSAPVWMKTNGSAVGGSLKAEYYAAYAAYFVKYIQAMEAKGVKVDAITIQNEPYNAVNNPSMTMTPLVQTGFIKYFLGPAFASKNIKTKIIIWDHNCDDMTFPLEVLNDAGARPFIDGSAFHLYAGNINSISQVHAAYPDKKLYFTEQWTSATGVFKDELMWHTDNIIIGSMLNHCSVALEWNLANGPNFEPHTAGGCPQCMGAITINGSSLQRNVSYYIVAQASKFIPAGSVRIESASGSATIKTVAFLTPAGKKVLLLLNTGAKQDINIKLNGAFAPLTLAGESVSTIMW